MFIPASEVKVYFYLDFLLYADTGLKLVEMLGYGAWSREFKIKIMIKKS